MQSFQQSSLEKGNEKGLEVLSVPGNTGLPFNKPLSSNLIVEEPVEGFTSCYGLASVASLSSLPTPEVEQEVPSPEHDLVSRGQLSSRSPLRARPLEPDTHDSGNPSNEVLPVSNWNQRPSSTTKDPLSIASLPGSTQDFRGVLSQELRTQPVFISLLLYHNYKPVLTYKHGYY